MREHLDLVRSTGSGISRRLSESTTAYQLDAKVLTNGT